MAPDMKPSPHLSILSRGIGRAQKKEHEREDIAFEPQDFFNARKRNVRRLPAHGNASHCAYSRPTSTMIATAKEETAVGSTYAPMSLKTRKGALLLFSEDFAETVKRRPTRKKRREILQENPNQSNRLQLEKLGDLAEAILTYDNSERKTLAKFDRSSMNPRPIRPGYSAKRYLSRLTRSFDHQLLDDLLSRGIVCEKTLFTSNPLLPHIRRRIDDDLSRVPSPYRLLQQMLIGPGLFSGFSFISERSDGAVKFDYSELGGKECESLQMVQVKDGVEREVTYHELSAAEKLNALADVLVKSAIGHALQVHRQNLKRSAVEDISEDENEDLEDTGTPEMYLKPWRQVNIKDAVQIYLHGPQSERLLRLSEHPPLKRNSIDMRSVSDDLYASDSSTGGESTSFVSSRRSSLGFPATTSTSYQRKNTERKNQKNWKKTLTTRNRRRMMTPIIDSRMASREVTLNNITVLPPIAPNKSTAVLQKDRDPLPQSDDVIFERMLKEEDQRLSYFLTGVLTVGGLMQNMGPRERLGYERRRWRRTAAAEESALTVQSFGIFKDTATKRTSNQKPVSFKRDSAVVDGSVVMIPDGEFVQVGQSIQRNERTPRNPFNGHQSNRNRLKLATKDSAQTDTELIMGLAEGAKNLASLVLSDPDAGQDLKQDALKASELWTSAHKEQSGGKNYKIGKALKSFGGSLKMATSGANDESFTEYKDMLAETLLNIASQLSGKQFESLTKDANISPELMNSLLTRTVNPKEVTVVKDSRGRSVITVKSDKRHSQGVTSRRHEKKTGYKSSESGILSGFSDDDVDNKQTSSVVVSLPGSKLHRIGDVIKSNDTSEQQNNSGRKESDRDTSNDKEAVTGTSGGKSELEKLYVKLGMAGNADASKKSLTKKKTKKKKRTKQNSGAEETDQEQTDRDEAKDTDKRKKEKRPKEKALALGDLEMQEAPDDTEEFGLIGGTWSEEGTKSLVVKVPRATSDEGEEEEEEEEEDPNPSLSDASSGKSGLNRQNRAAQREAKAELRRQEVLKRRREREEQAKLEREEAERMERIARELEEERLRNEEAKRLEKERQSEARRRREEERLARQRREELDAERESQLKEEYLRKLEEMRRQEEEEERIRLELEEKRRLEEEERLRLEQETMAKLQAEENERILRLRREEEEKLRELGEEERQRRLEDERRAAEEAIRLAEELTARQEQLQRRLQFNRSLRVESSDLGQSQSVSRAFVFSYIELIKWLGLDTTKKTKQKTKYRRKDNAQNG